MTFAKQRFAARRTPDITGRVHASKGQAAWFNGLLLRARAGEITDLIVEPSYRIEIGGEWVCNVKADASYLEDGRRRVVDYKGVEGDTPISRLKRRLVRAQHKIEIEIVGPAAARKSKRAAYVGQRETGKISTDQKQLKRAPGPSR